MRKSFDGFEVHMTVRTSGRLADELAVLRDDLDHGTRDRLAFADRLHKHVACRVGIALHEQAEIRDEDEPPCIHVLVDRFPVFLDVLCVSLVLVLGGLHALRGEEEQAA